MGVGAGGGDCVMSGAATAAPVVLWLGADTGRDVRDGSLTGRLRFALLSGQVRLGHR